MTWRRSRLLIAHSSRIWVFKQVVLPWTWGADPARRRWHYPDPDTATVTDLVYTRVDGGWELHKSSYPKLRLAPDWLRNQLTAPGLRSPNTVLAPAECGRQ